MPDISVRLDTVPFQKAIKAAYSNQLPYAVSRALNEVAFASLRELKAHQRREFIIRRPWVVKGTVVEESSKQNLRAEVGSIRPFMALQATGGIKRPGPGKSSLSIPTTNLVSKNRVPSKDTQWPKHLLGKSNKRFRYFIRGSSLIRVGRKDEASSNRRLWLFRKSARIQKRFNLAETVEGVMFTRWDPTVLKWIEKALATKK